MAAARRLEVSTLHSKLTPWVVLDETYLGAYGRVRDQYLISEPTAGASAGIGEGDYGVRFTLICNAASTSEALLCGALRRLGARRYVSGGVPRRVERRRDLAAKKKIWTAATGGL